MCDLKWHATIHGVVVLVRNCCCAQYNCNANNILHQTNEYVWQHVDILAGPQGLLLSTVKRRKLSWFAHVCRHGTLPKIILHGTVDDVVIAREDLVSHGRTISRNGQASRCRHWCASRTRMTEVALCQSTQCRLSVKGIS